MSNFEIPALNLREKEDFGPLFPGVNFKITNFEINPIYNGSGFEMEFHSETT
jgi:hypothetical protein